MDDKVIVLNMKTAELDSLSNLHNKISGKSLNEILDDLYHLNNDYLKPEPYYAKYNKRRKNGF